jgi:hypothetical protein
MKTKLTLVLTTLAFVVPAFAGPSDSAAFAIRHAREAAQANQTVVVADNSGPINYVPSSSGKGGTVVAQSNRGSTNIALFKSKKSSAECSSCCKADAQKR